jgi:hypothetical protein
MQQQTTQQKRAEDPVRRPSVKLNGREIPRNEAGDPSFVDLYYDAGVKRADLKAVLDVFDADEVVLLVNKALYQMEYSRTVHRNRAQRERDLQKPIKLIFKEMFPHQSWLKATEGQVEQCLVEYKRRQEG